MLEAPGRVLPRPMSLCQAPPGELAFLIDAIGPGTRALCALAPGDAIHVLGPLGNGFDLDVAAPAPRRRWDRDRADAVPARGARRSAPAILGFRSDRHAEAARLLPGARSSWSRGS